MSYGQWKPYVPVAQRRAEAKRKMAKLKKKGLAVQPIEIEGRKIAKSFWGIAWCDHLESFSDLANRIPRGRTYARNGSICHLAIEKGKVTAMVSGSEIYKVEVNINALASKRWDTVKKNCTGQVSSVLELLQGKLSESVMTVVTDQKTGLFPAPKEIKFTCDCPDYASMCKHIAAVLYGVGARLDHQPDLLFTLRGVDHQELITADISVADTGPKKGGRRRIAADNLEDVFGIDMADDAPAPRRPSAKKAAKKTTIEKVTTQPRNADGDLIFTSSDILKLRKEFDMNVSEFSRVTRVTPASIHQWEKKSGELALRKKSRDKLERVFKFTKQKANQELRKYN